MPLQDPPQIENFDFWGHADGNVSAHPEELIGDSINVEERVSNSKEQDLKRGVY